MIYLDHHAATPLGGVATEAMVRAADEAWANPASPHAAGRAARRWLEDARRTVAEAIGARPAEMVMTGGGTEACNLMVLGLSAATGAPPTAGSSRPPAASRVITTAIEHPAMAAAVARLGAAGAEVITLAVPAGSPPPPAALRALITDEDHTDALAKHTLVALQWINHETGTVLPVEHYGQVCRDLGARLAIDGTQALGKLPVDVTQVGAHAMAFASHKIGGPAGSGALWLAPHLAIEPQVVGGGQERGRRAGSPDVLAAVGFGAAARCVGPRCEAMDEIAGLRDRLEQHLVALGGVVNGAGGPRVATVTNVSFRGRRGPALVAALDVEGVCVAAGAACSSGLTEDSPVLRAMYPDEPWRAGSALRISLGPETTSADVARATDVIERVLKRGAAKI